MVCRKCVLWRNFPQNLYHDAVPSLVLGAKGTSHSENLFYNPEFFASDEAKLTPKLCRSPETRPGMFISVGPPSFTGLAFIGMANAAIEVFPHTFVLGTAAVPTAQILKIVAVFLAIVLWSLSLFFFCISLLATLNGIKKMSFHLVSQRASKASV